MDGSVARLRLVSLLETASFLALLTMMAIGSEGGVSVVGLVHGLLFLWYAVLVLSEREELGWTWTFAVVAIITGPVGAILVLERLRRTGGIARDDLS
jgi:integral membrane protein